MWFIAALLCSHTWYSKTIFGQTLGRGAICQKRGHAHKTKNIWMPLNETNSCILYKWQTNSTNQGLSGLKSELNSFPIHVDVSYVCWTLSAKSCAISLPPFPSHCLFIYVLSHPSVLFHPLYVPPFLFISIPSLIFSVLSWQVPASLKICLL